MVVQPVGPLPASTYWRRRAVLLGAVLLLLVLLRACTGGGGAPMRTTGSSALPSRTPSAPPAPTRAAPSGTPTKAAGSATPSATAATSPVAVGSCRDAALSLVASADASSYAVGSSPLLAVTIRNTGTVPCRRDLGSGAVELLVFSGADRIWSSDDCAPGTASDTVLLVPGASRTVKLSWSGKRSQPGCAGDRSQALAGTYRVTGRVGTLRGAAGSFQLA